VKVIDIYPGATETAIWSEEMLAQHRHRMMHPENIAEMIGYLLSLPPHVMPEEVVLRPQLGDL
jgi:NADP-dependent 3-hydroxy acid dehydrogenase YdfG